MCMLSLLQRNDHRALLRGLLATLIFAGYSSPSGATIEEQRAESVHNTLHPGRCLTAGVHISRHVRQAEACSQVCRLSFRSSGPPRPR